MSPALAAIYFESMTPKLKVLAGLEPRLEGGGNNWYAPPDELLNGRVVLKPVRKNILSKLSSEGIQTIGMSVFKRHRKEMDLEIEKSLLDSNTNWRNNIMTKTSQLWDDLAAAATRRNTEQIVKYYNKFDYLYRLSIAKIEILIHESAITEIKNVREAAIQEMKNKYETLLKQQATLLYDEYEKKLEEEKLRLKNDFIRNLEVNRTAMGNKIHDLNVDKHRAVETLRHSLQCQNLACGVYVALKEREESSREMEKLQRKQKKQVHIMTDTIYMKDFEIRLQRAKEKKREEFRFIWKKKVCLALKAFQKFVLYCLNMLPEHAEFFINMEKLMLLQLNETLDDPDASSIIEEESEQFHTPVPQPNTFYLFCDRGYKAQVERDLCPKHSGASTPSGLPVIIVNKRCLYAACDNFEQFGNKIREYLHGSRGDDADFKDDNIYEHFVPVKYGSSQQLLELKLESSLLQILQQELKNVQKDEDKAIVKCHSCGLPWCHSCQDSLPPAVTVDGVKEIKPASSSKTSSKVSRDKDGSLVNLDHEREPSWNSFFKHVEPKMCSCGKTARKHLAENLPVYMKQKSYGPPEIPGYEMCSIEELKTLVETARKDIHRSVLVTGTGPVDTGPPVDDSRTKDACVQYSDPLVEEMCMCYSDDEFTKFMIDMQLNVGPNTNFDTMAPSFMSKRVSSFATSRVQSLRDLVTSLSELKFIFTKEDCDF
ncbi:hypothetical protein PYW07_005980 [Mythimna separata]|uniref:Uncharacterized protein n=1 Tax=Mythimna separata TaxID=271217 RepID=A0AAD8DSL7_MYTSE|nr:hypothetical protein PYW07_005980 [Mythimna separata]